MVAAVVMMRVPMLSAGPPAFEMLGPGGGAVADKIRQFVSRGSWRVLFGVCGRTSSPNACLGEFALAKIPRRSDAGAVRMGR